MRQISLLHLQKLINSAVAMGISDINFDNFDNVAVRIFQELAYESKLNHLAQRILASSFFFEDKHRSFVVM